MPHSAPVVAVQLDSEWIELSGNANVNVSRIAVSDLRAGQHARAGIRGELVKAGQDPDSVTVLVDVEVLVAEDARSARKELARLGITSAPSSIQYVGTATGLASLIEDIKTAEVGDGVTLIPLVAPRVLETVIDNVLPILRNFTVEQGAVDRALGHYNIERTTLAS